MSLSFEEQISIGRKLSDSEYNKYVEDFHKDYNAQPFTLKAKRKSIRNKRFISPDAGRMF